MAEHLLTKIDLIEERENGSRAPVAELRSAASGWSPLAAGGRRSGILPRMTRPVVLGVVGDSAAGKTTLTRGVVRVLGGREQVSYISGDDYHRYERQQQAELGITPLNPTANHLDILGQHLAHLRDREPVLKPTYDHRSGTLGPPGVRPPELLRRGRGAAQLQLGEALLRL